MSGRRLDGCASRRIPSPRSLTSRPKRPRTRRMVTLHQTPIDSHESNGHVERYFGTLHPQIRAMRLTLDEELGVMIFPTNPSSSSGPDLGGPQAASGPAGLEEQAARPVTPPPVPQGVPVPVRLGTRCPRELSPTPGCATCCHRRQWGQGFRTQRGLPQACTTYCHSSGVPSWRR